MRNRHFPRLCTSCQAPMARQEAACWSCGAVWAEDVRPSRGPRMTAERSAARPVVVPMPAIVPVPAGVALAEPSADEDRRKVAAS